MMKTLLIAVSLAALCSTAQAGSQKSFGCGYRSPFEGDAYKAFVKENAHNGMAVTLLDHFIGLWQSQEQARICEAYARGEPVEIGCLFDRRDYDAILAMMPENYRALNKQELNAWAAGRELSLAREARKYMNIAHNTCVKAGVYKGKLREVD